MAGYNARKLVIDWDSTTLAGVQSKSFSINNEMVDVTTDDDAGWRTLLADPGLRSVEVTVSGITSDEVLLADVMAASISATTLDVTLPTSLSSAGTLSGEFYISNFEENAGSSDGAVEFSASFMSSGEITYTAST